MKNHQNRNRSARKPALSTIGLAVITTLLASGAYASPEPSGTPFKTVQSDNYNDASINASIEGGSGSITSGGAQSGSTNTLDSNLLRASAIANTSSNSIDLSLTASSQGTDGVASYTNARNAGQVTSNVYDNNLSVELDGLGSNAVVNTANTGNAIGASSIANNAASSIAGQVPVAYSSGKAGSVQLNGAIDGYAANAASGSIALSTVQQTGGYAAASAGGNTIDTSIYASDASQVQGAVSVDNNTISSSVKGNSATSTADIRSGGASAFAGSAVIANQQAVSGALDVEGGFGFGAIGSNLHAETYGSAIAAGVFGNEASGATLNGSLSVKANSITSSVTGNETLGNGTAGNRILLSSDMAFAGSGGPVGNSQSVIEGMSSATVTADLVIGNSQSNTGTSLSSNTGYSTVIGQAEGLAQATLDVSGNSITSAAKGNAASSAISTGSAAAASFAGTAALASQQLNSGSSVSADTFFSIVGAQAGTYDNAGVADSAMSATGNRSAATAYGNESAQSLSLSANSLSTGNWPAVLTSTASDVDASVSALGAATVTNLQRNVNSTVSANNVFSVIGVEADTRGTAGQTLTSSSFAASGNTQEAVALGSGANNAIALNGNIVGAGAGISSLQTSDSISSVSAAVTGAAVAVNADTHVTDSTLAVTGNLQRAIGYGNSVANSLSVKAGSTSFSALDVEGYAPTSSVAFNANNGLQFASAQPTATAGYGIVNNQSAQASVSAAAVAGSNAMDMGLSAANLIVEGSLVRSSANNDANAFIGAAYGNDAANRMALDLGNVSAANASVGSVTNVQAMPNSQTVISAAATGGPAMQTFVEDSVVDSTISTSSNAIQALAYGNRATANQLSVKAGNIDGAGYYGMPSGSGFGFGGNFGSDNGVFTAGTLAVQNVQMAQGTVSASQISTDSSLSENAAPAAEVRVTLGQDGTSGRTISGSSVLLDSNRSVASATANAAASGLSLEGTNVSSSSALQNVQVSSSTVQAAIGRQGKAGTPAGDPVPFTATVEQFLSANFVNNSATPVTLVSSIATEGLTSEQITYLTTNGWTNNGSTLSKSTPQGSLTPTQYAALSTATPATTTVSGVTPGTLGTPAIPNQGGVVLAVRGSGVGIANSTLAVSNNVTSGSVTGNSAANSVEVKGVNLVSGTENNGTMAMTMGMGMGASMVWGDNTLANQQFSTSGALSSNVFGSFGIDVAQGTGIDSSTLSVSGNRQASLAVANTAANSLALSGTNIDAGAGLVSSQYGNSTVNVSSALELFAPVASQGSSISLSDNKNTALAVVNDVANTLSVSATNLASLDNTGPASVGQGGGYASHVLVNSQEANTAAISTATTTLYNQDQSAVTSNGLLNSSVRVSGNSTVAEASANRASNTLALNGSALMGATGGLSNTQGSSSLVQATAITSTSVSVASASPALNQGGITLDGNSTTALAQGNVATNVLNATAGSLYGSAANAAGTQANGSAQATLAVSNNQYNAGSISASSYAPSYQVALNSSGVTGGAVSVTGNALTAEALGNSATNRVTVNALSNSTPTAAVANYQTNSGSVSANVTSVNFGIGISGGATNSALRTGGNQVTATAIGNSSVSSIAAAVR